MVGFDFHPVGRTVPSIHVCLDLLEKKVVSIFKSQCKGTPKASSIFLSFFLKTPPAFFLQQQNREKALILTSSPWDSAKEIENGVCGGGREGLGKEEKKSRTQLIFKTMIESGDASLHLEKI